MFLLATCFFAWRFNGICFLEMYGRYTCGGPELWVSPCFCVPCLFPVFLSSLCCLYWRLKKKEQKEQAAAQQAAARAARAKALEAAIGQEKIATTRDENPDRCPICFMQLDQDPLGSYYNINESLSWTICNQCTHVSHPVCLEKWTGNCPSCNTGTLTTVPIPPRTRKELEQRPRLAPPSHVGGGGVAPDEPLFFTLAVKDLPPSRPPSPHSSS